MTVILSADVAALTIPQPCEMCREAHGGKGDLEYRQTGFCPSCGGLLSLHPSWPDPPSDLNYECFIATQRATRPACDCPACPDSDLHWVGCHSLEPHCTRVRPPLVRFAVQDGPCPPEHIGQRTEIRTAMRCDNVQFIDDVTPIKCDRGRLVNCYLGISRPCPDCTSGVRPGVVVGTTTITGSYPIVEWVDFRRKGPVIIYHSQTKQLRLWFPPGRTDVWWVDISSELAHQHWTPGRHAWALTDTEATE